MALLQPAPVSSDRFLYKDFVFTAEASDLNDISMGRVYDDACDIGFTIISQRTGRAAVFVKVGEAKDREGEVSAFIFDCVTPHLRHLKVCLWND